MTEKNKKTEYTITGTFIKEGIYNNLQTFIPLMQSLFINRTDAVSRRISNKQKTIYKPCCTNDGTMTCPQTNDQSAKFKGCPVKSLIHVDEALIKQHIEGKIFLGIYPVDYKTNTTKFLSFDLDNHDGNTDPIGDLKVLTEVCNKRKIPIYAFRSQSGTGIHAYVFFEKPLSAKNARKLGHFIITEAAEMHDNKRISSFDAVFPKQDQLDQNTPLGNPIALPYQGWAIDLENTVVLDPKNDYKLPFDDQTKVLSEILKLSIDSFKNILASILKKNQMAIPKSSNQSNSNETIGFIDEVKLSARFVATFKDRIRYSYELGKWIIWRHHNWNIDEKAFVVQLMISCLNMIRKKATIAGDKDKIKMVSKFRNFNRIKSTLNMSATYPQIVVDLEDFDREPWLLNTNNGIINLKTRKLEKHNPSLYISKHIDTKYDPQSKCPGWLKFLDQIMGNDQKMVNFLKRAIGYSLTGSNVEQKLFYLYGTGANGKSTFLNIIRKLLGTFANNTPFDTFLTGRNTGSPRDDLARLRGIRFLTTVEVEPGKTISEATIKSATGGDPITCRPLYGNYFSYIPQFKIWMSANTMINVRGTDNGIWRRIILIPFNKSFSANNQDQELQAKLEAELPGILNWAIEGCIEWQSIGLNAPQQVLNATQNYRSSQDPLSDFVRERCLFKSGYYTSKKDLYEQYTQYCDKTMIILLKKECLEN